MENNEYATKALELVAKTMEERYTLEKWMLGKGYTPDTHLVCDNIEEHINNPIETPYRCWAVDKNTYNLIEKEK